MKNLGGWLKQMIKKELVSQLQGKLKALSLLIYGMESKYTELTFYSLGLCDYIFCLSIVVSIGAHTSRVVVKKIFNFTLIINTTL
jgi:hypothetical protein